LRYGSRVRRSRLRRRDYSCSRSIGYLLNGQLQDKLLSACKISQVYPGTPMSAPPARSLPKGLQLRKGFPTPFLSFEP
jgi:hypothetical protein